MAISITTFLSSPRIGGNSDLLTDEIIRGARKNGAQVEKIYLNKLLIKPCTGCRVCLKSVSAPCVIKDDMASLLEKIRNSDGLIFSSPIYFCAVNGQMKIFLDRLNALFDNSYNALTGKQAALAFTYAEKDPLKSGVFNALQMFRDAFTALNVRLTGWVHASCHEKGEIINNTDVLNEAFLLRQKFAEDPNK